MIDDGSTDRSGEICERYKEQDRRIHVVHQKNSGVTVARANGIKEAKGEWITFVDSDDQLPNDTIETYWNNLSDDYDILIGKISDSITTNIISIDNYRNYMIEGLVAPSPWAKLYRKSLFNDHIFDIPKDICYGEDYLMNIRLAFELTKPIYVLHHTVYIYQQNTSTSISRRFVKTPEYEAKYRQILYNSLSPDIIDKYRNVLIKAGIISWRSLCGSKLNVKKLADSSFYKDLIDEINHYNYPLSLFDKIILSTSFTSRLCLLMVSKLRRITSRIKTC